MRTTTKTTGLLSSFFLAAALLTSTVSAQNRNEWSSFSALNVAQDMARDTSGTVWIATTGGVVGYRPKDGSFEIVRNTEGLARLDATAVGVDPKRGDLYVGSGDGSISIRKKSGSWIYSTEIAANLEHSVRRINGFRFHGDTVYILTEFGVAVYNPINNTYIESYLRFGDPPVDASVYDLLNWQGRIWLATSAGVASAPESARDLPFPPAWKVERIGVDTVYSLAAFNGMLLAGTNTGGYLRDDAGNYGRRTDLSDKTTLFASAGESLVAASGSTISRWSGSAFIQASETPETASAISIEPSGDVAVGFPSHGFGILAGDSLELHIPNAPASNTFKDLTLAGDGSIWAAGGFGGVSRLKDDVWSAYTQDNLPLIQLGGADNDVWNVGPGTGGSVWVGQHGTGYLRFTPDDAEHATATRFNAENSPIRSENCNKGYVIGGRAVTDANGRTWLPCFYPDRAGCTALMVKLRDDEQSSDGSGFEPFQIDVRGHAQPARIYRWLVIDQSGTKWMGADEATFERPGLLYFNDHSTLQNTSDDSWDLITTDDGLPNNQQSALAVDDDNQIWIGTSSGLAVLSNPNGVVFEHQRPSLRTIRLLGDLPIHAIAVDALNQKWIGTDQGVFVLSADGTELAGRFTSANSPLVSDNVFSILAVNATGDIYIGTDNGMSKISTSAVESSSSSTLSVSPQPFVVPAAEPLRIIGLPAGASVKILTVSGSLVKEFDSPGGSVAFWDGLDQSGKVVPSGVYIIAGSDKLGDTTVLGKVAVLHR